MKVNFTFFKVKASSLKTQGRYMMQRHIHDLNTFEYYSHLIPGIDKMKGVTKLLVYLFKLNKFIPQHIFFPFLIEIFLLIIKFKTLNTSKQYSNGKDLLVNLGCGRTGKMRWVNVDIFKYSGVNYIYDC